jgi:ribosomal protein S12 methylthiotransferase
VDNEVVVHGKNLRIGEFVNVRITKAYDYDIEGEVTPPGTKILQFAIRTTGI